MNLQEQTQLQWDKVKKTNKGSKGWQSFRKMHSELCFEMGKDFNVYGVERPLTKLK